MGLTNDSTHLKISPILRAPFSTRSFAELAQLVRSVTIRSVFGSHAAVRTPEAPRESLVVCQVSQVSAWFRFTL